MNKSDARRKAAERRQSRRDERTAYQQLDHLNSKFGKGKGAKKERARLDSLTSNSPRDNMG